MIMKYFSVLLLITLFFTSCWRNQQQEQSAQADAVMQNPMLHAVKVNEVLQANAYTYLNVSENGSDYWIAVSKQDASPGEQYIFEKSLEMTDFKSKDLDKLFERILFVDNLVSADHANQDISEKNIKDHMGRKTIGFDENIHIEKSQDDLTIENLFKNSSTYEGKTVTVKGQVTKVNNNIMNKNWLHIQDGTKFNDNYDLTITSSMNAQNGDIITATGKVVLNKDFGAGYFYKLLIEDAEITSKKAQI